jgi:hypothetical protein
MRLRSAWSGELWPTEGFVAVFLKPKEGTDTYLMRSDITSDEDTICERTLGSARLTRLPLLYISDRSYEDPVGLRRAPMLGCHLLLSIRDYHMVLLTMA